MQETAASPSVFLLITTASALAWHIAVKRYGAALIGAVVTTVIAFQVVDYLVLGSLAPYFYVTMVTSAIPALFIAAVIGLPFVLFRRRG